MHKGFDHDKFYFDCDKYECDQMVSYNSSNLIKSRFIDWKPYEYDHTYTMRSVGEYMQEQQSRKELLLQTMLSKLIDDGYYVLQDLFLLRERRKWQKNLSSGINKISMRAI